MTATLTEKLEIVLGKISGFEEKLNKIDEKLDNLRIEYLNNKRIQQIEKVCQIQKDKNKELDILIEELKDVIIQEKLEISTIKPPIVEGFRTSRWI